MLKLEEEYGYEPKLKYRILSKAYDNDHIDFLNRR